MRLNIRTPAVLTFEELVDSAREMCRVNMQTRGVGLLSSMDPRQAAADFKTVRLSVGRQVGKTSYITSRATDGDLIIVPNQAMSDYIIRHHNPRGTLALSHDFAPVGNSAFCRNIRGRSFQNIYVDEASMCERLSSYFMHVVYELTVDHRNNTQQYILLG